MLLTIITITQNNLNGLKHTYKSLSEQSFQGFEWLVIDGHSGDGTVDFLQKAQADYISEPDQGIYDAMNKGIVRTQGFFVLFLNAGDALANDNTLQDIVSYIEELQETPDFIYGDALEERIGTHPSYKTARPYQKAAFGMFTHHQAMIYRHDLIGDLRYDLSYKIAADYKFTLEFLRKAKTIIYCPFPLCLFENGGISQQQATLGRNEQHQIRKELNYTGHLRNTGITALQKIIWTLRVKFPTLYWQIKSKTGKHKS